MESPGVVEAVNEALDKADELRTIFRSALQKLKSDSSEAKRQLVNQQSKVRQALELIDGKNISRAKMLLKVDTEYLRRTLPGESCSDHLH